MGKVKRRKVGIYVRVSTGKQEADNQLIQLREYCKKEKYNIYWEYSDIMSGGYKSRPQFNRLFEDAHKKVFDIVLFWDLSRFSRSGALYTIQKLEELQRIGIDYISYNEPYINSIGQFKEVIIALLSCVAKMERQKISERTKAGLERTKRNGQILGRPEGSKDKKKRYRRFFKDIYKGVE